MVQCLGLLLTVTKGTLTPDNRKSFCFSLGCNCSGDSVYFYLVFLNNAWLWSVKQHLLSNFLQYKFPKTLSNNCL